MKMRRIVVLFTVAAFMALMLVVGAVPAFAVASSQASCQGIAAASTDTLLGGPGARADTVHEVIGEEEPPGALFSDFSKFHSGTREECLA